MITSNNLKKYILFFFIVSQFSSLKIFCQTIIKGKINDEETNEELIGASLKS
jgi:hypothetical protein